ncbi:uncharacterized protein LOC131617988 isoform X1 [Vicia villosa]|uniref:uncharacterized protein LOC131617988 isoform X1 n=1 Tax=Vicia villosa TaxID=3911 RepID=UPI00273BA244|nr:uncharacterized protein LOC131617988 isoform X1 [Vicia villosa]
MDRNSRKKDDRKKQFMAETAAFRKKQIATRIARAEYERIARNLSVYDFTLYPLPGYFGGAVPVVIDKSIRPRLIKFCRIALKKFNNHKNQGPEFDFHDLVKSTRTHTMFYITFTAARKQDAFSTIFRTKVKRTMIKRDIDGVIKRDIDGLIKIVFCGIKRKTRRGLRKLLPHWKHLICLGLRKLRMLDC